VIQQAAAKYSTTLTSGLPRELIGIVTQSSELQDCIQVILSADIELSITLGVHDPKNWYVWMMEAIECPLCVHPLSLPNTKTISRVPAGSAFSTKQHKMILKD